MTLSSQQESALREIRAQSLQTLRQAIGPTGTPVVLLDIPRHRNLGDSLIWWGEESYLRELGYPVVYRSDYSQFSEAVFSTAGRNAVVLFQGGGNFGDLYPEFHDFRLRVMERHPCVRYVILPQSVFFRSETEVARTRRVLETCSVELLVRDFGSLEYCREHFPRTHAEFCHDMALGFDPRSNAVTIPSKIVVVARRDAESLRGNRSALRDAPDWSDGGLFNDSLWNLLSALGGVVRRTPLRNSWAAQRILEHANLAMLRLNTRAAVRSFEGAEYVVTDRLHAHVLACLMGIENYFADNTYGKLSAVFDASTSRIGLGNRCDSLASAFSLAVESCDE